MSAVKKRQKTANETAKEMRRDLGYWLKGKREEAGVTQADLASLLKLKYYSFISQVENGACRIPQELYGIWADGIGVERQEFAKIVLQHLEPGLYEILFE
ncbi:MAG: helix-turn-helix transcriptional regulator [Pseudomonadota bacterium]